LSRGRKEYRALEEPVRSVALGLDQILVKTLPADLNVVKKNPALLWCIGYYLDGEGLSTVSPMDMARYVKALNFAIRQQLDKFTNEDMKVAAQILFGYAPGASGTLLKIREAKVADVYNVSVRTVQRWREERIVPPLSWQLLSENLQLL
jgi:hypothetical protein